MDERSIQRVKIEGRKGFECIRTKKDVKESIVEPTMLAKCKAWLKLDRSGKCLVLSQPILA